MKNSSKLESHIYMHKAMINNMNYGIIFFNSDHIILEINTKAMEIMELEENQLLGTSILKPTIFDLYSLAE